MTTIDFFISLVLALMMFGIGMSIRFVEFKKLFEHRKSLYLGLSLQMIFLPIFAFTIAWFAPISPAFKLGIVLVSICPGGTTSNFISYILHANTALSVALTSINSFLILITIPLFTALGYDIFYPNETYHDFSILQNVIQVLLIVVLPSILGMTVRHYKSYFAKRIEKSLKWVNTALLAAVFLIKFLAGKEHGGTDISTEDILQILPYALALNVVSMFVSDIFGKWFRVGKVNRITISIEVGLQNTALAILIAGTLLKSAEMTKPALVFALFSFFTTFGFGYWKKKSS
ncbi:MAG: bile acid:sodium symporter family protein [Flavobacteriales bacterium]|jgi:BASS family bile acid:Na+ symporter|nr:bile acid:sodium symporter family protein [Flavobacteriales bacterium]